MRSTLISRVVVAQLKGYEANEEILNTLITTA